MALQVTGVVLALALPAAPAGAADSGEALARRVDARQAGVRDLTARFVQSYRSGVLGREVTERGTVAIKKPGPHALGIPRAREEDSSSPTASSSSSTCPPTSRSSSRRRTPATRASPRSLLGGGRILEHFQAFAEDPLPGRERLRLVPRKPDADVQRVYLDLDAEARVVAIEVWDAQGGHSRFQFEGVKENVGVKDDAFRFQPPAGRRGRDRMRLRAAAALLVVASLGCASAGAFRSGERAERSREYDRAVLEYSRALKLSPDNVQYQRSLERARQRAAEAHARAGAPPVGARPAQGRERRDAARGGPAAGRGVARSPSCARSRRCARRARPPPPCRRSRSARASARCPASCWGRRAREPLGLSFRSTSLRDAYLALGKAAGVNFVFDPQFQDTTVSLDARTSRSSRRSRRSPPPAARSTA